MTDTVAPPAPRAADDEAARPGGSFLLSLRPWVLVIAFVALIPVALTKAAWAADGASDDFNRSVLVAPFDLVWALILARWVLQHRGRSWTRPTPLQWIGIALAADLVIALAFHPSPLGAVEALRLLGAWAVVDTVVEAGAARRTVLLTGITVVGVVEAVLGMAQSLHHAVLGIRPLEFPAVLYPFGSSRAAQGGMDHPYHLACLLLVALCAALLGVREAARRGPWLAAVALLGCGIAATFSRSAVLGLAGVVAVLVVTGFRRREVGTALAGIAIVLGVGIGMVAFGDGWIAKAKTSTNAQEADSARRDRLDEAWGLFRSSPVVGIGPGRYVTVLSERKGRAQLPAHDVIAHEAAEGGVLAGLLTAALLAGLAGWSWRRGGWAFAVLLSLVPFFVLDAYPYTFATGLALTAVWLGLLLLAGRTDREAPPA